MTCARRDGDTIYLFGRLFPGHVETALDAVLADCSRLMCSPIHCETNGDKGYLARELRQQGIPVRSYQEHTNKYQKIATYLRKWWPHLIFLDSTDPAYLEQIRTYSDAAAHDDAPDSAASLLRILDRAGGSAPRLRARSQVP